MIPIPDLQRPRSVAKAAATVEAREADLAAAREAVEQATAAIGPALIEDREAYAAALDAGRPDPGRTNEQAARDALAEAERLLAAEGLRVDRARAELDQTLDTVLDGWETALTAATGKLETESLALVDQLEHAEEQRATARVQLAWLRNRRDGTKLPNLDLVRPALSSIVINRVDSTTTHPVPALLAGIRDGIRATSLEVQAARAAERAAEQARQAERAAEQVRQVEQEAREAEAAAQFAATFET
jgi:hypothetical protein